MRHNAQALVKPLQSLLTCRTTAINEKCMKEAIQWETMSTIMRFCLVFSVLLNIASFYIFVLVGDQTFEPINITTKIDGPPLNGKVLKMMKPLGWAGMGLQVASWIVYWIFGAGLSKKAKVIKANLTT
jgi:hypothetical protein